MGYIYRITNTINNKYYIGITTKNNPNERWQAHINSIKYGNGCPLLTRALNKYGVDKFKFEVIIICFDEDLYHYEKEYILKYKSLAPSGYNAHPGGEFGGNFRGKSHTDETKRKIGIKISERNKNPDFKQRISTSVSNFNRTHNIGELMRKSIKWQNAIKNGKIGHGQNQEVKNKIKESLLKYYENNGSPINREKHSEIMTRVNGRKINQYSKDGICMRTFDSIILASKSTGIGRCSIQSNAAGRTNTGGGYIWKYID